MPTPSSQPQSQSTIQASAGMEGGEALKKGEMERGQRGKGEGQSRWLRRCKELDQGQEAAKRSGSGGVRVYLCEMEVVGELEE
mmetsp:Transcript_768/g.1311  ORF Transcript_768/g.1311 Transcript_768/m.1311 type:complete len:83 (-) Transcript_768:117-365(-)